MSPADDVNAILILGLCLFAYLIMPRFVLRWFGFEVTVTRCLNNTVPCGWSSDGVYRFRR